MKTELKEGICYSKLVKFTFLVSHFRIFTCFQCNRVLVDVHPNKCDTMTSRRLWGRIFLKNTFSFNWYIYITVWNKVVCLKMCNKHTIFTLVSLIPPSDNKIFAHVFLHKFRWQNLVTNIRAMRLGSKQISFRPNAACKLSNSNQFLMPLNLLCPFKFPYSKFALKMLF